MKKLSCITTTFHKSAKILFLCICLFCAACSKDSAKPTSNRNGEEECIPGKSYTYFRMPFSLEYRTQGILTFSLTCDSTEGTLVLNKDYNLLKAGIPYIGIGKRYTFPESRYALYTFKIPIQEGSEKTCLDQSITLSLSLSAKGDSKWLSGAITVYCGPSTLHSRPSGIMRLSGPLEEVDGP